MAFVSRQNSPVWDEMHLWGVGYHIVNTGRFDIPSNGLHPPLTHYLNSLPLLGREVPQDIFRVARSEWELRGADCERGRRLLDLVGYETFLRSRWPFIAMYLLAGAILFLWSRREWGDAGGLFSLCLYLLCPNLMSHAFLLTTDFAVAAAMFVAIFGCWQATQTPGPVWIAVFLAGFALAPAAKLTGLLIDPISALLVVASLLQTSHSIWIPGRGTLKVSRLRFLLYWMGLGTLASGALYLCLVLLYQGDWSIATYRRAYAGARAMVERGQSILLDGQVTSGGVPEYYLKALIYKLTPAAFVAWLVAGIVPNGANRRTWVVLSAIGIAAVCWFSFSRYTLGMRYILLFFPLIYVAAGRLAAGLEDAIRKPSAATGRMMLCVAILCLGTASLAQSYPYPRSHFNQWLTSRAPYEAVADSDLDWGEGLIALREFVEEHHLGPIALSYHGSVHPAQFGIRTSFFENPVSGVPRNGNLPENGLFFISATTLSGVYLRHDPYAWLRRQKPVAVVGGTIYVFDLGKAKPEL